jgi:hypothetical protein
MPCHDCERCFYCEQPLSSRHEHDHFPVPGRHGGIATVPACVNCHDRKDRMSFADWMDGTGAAVEFLDAVRALPPTSRLVIAKLVGLLLDTRAQLETERAARAATPPGA